MYSVGAPASIISNTVGASTDNTISYTHLAASRYHGNEDAIGGCGINAATIDYHASRRGHRARYSTRRK